MNITKKIISIILAVIMCASLMIPAFAEDSHEKLRYLVIGDSIADGYGIRNREKAVYGYIVADTNGYEVIVNADSGGETTDSLLDKIQDSKPMRSQIAGADIISISIGGNDFTGCLDIEQMVSMALRYLFLRDTSSFDEIAVNTRSNFNEIMKEIRALNPDAVVVAQTVYKAWYGINGKAYDQVTKRVNNIIYDYQAQHPENFLIADVAGAFVGHKDYVTTDTIHPSAKGNVAIAKAILEVLYEAGLGKSTEPVINVEGIDYNFWYGSEKTFDGVMLYFFVRLLTGRLFVK